MYNRSCLNNSKYKDIIGEVTNYTLDFKYCDVLAYILDRHDEDEDIYETMEGSIYEEEAWTIIEHHCNPEDANYYKAYEETYEEIQEILEKAKEKGIK